MDIYFGSPQLQHICSQVTLLARGWGRERGGALARRLCELNAAQTLNELRAAPGNYRELAGDLSGHFAVDVQGAVEIIFRPANGLIAGPHDGAVDWNAVTSITIVAITHKQA